MSSSAQTPQPSHEPAPDQQVDHEVVDPQATAQRSAGQQATDQQATDQPATDQPATDQPATDQQATDQAPEASEVEWQRLSPKMLLIHPVQGLKELLPALIPALIVGNSSGDSRRELWNAGIGAIVVVFAALRWFTTRYRVTPTQVQLKTGVFARQTHTAPLDRVRTVDITAPVIHRLLGLVRVEIGSGTHGKGLQLDGLTAAEGEALRVALLHRRRAAAAAGETAPTGATGATGAAVTTPAGAPDLPPGHDPNLGPEHDSQHDPRLDAQTHPELYPESGTETDAEPEVELARFNPAWVRYAPFTTSGLVTGLAIFGVAQPFLNQMGLSVWDWAEDIAAHTAVLVIVLVALVVVLVVLAVLAMATYVLNFWGLRVVRHGAGTIRITRGLLTTRATTLEEARVRGVTMQEAILVRLLGGASLDAVSTGLRGEGGGSTLLPAADRDVVGRLADDVLGTSAPLHTRLVQHGPRALRRRWTRALLAGAIVLAPFVAAVLVWGWPWWVLVPAALPLLASVWLAPARYAALGHALVDDQLVTRAGAVQRTTTVLETRGIVGWTVHQSFFQRRAGLATLVAATAAGSGGYQVRDVPVDRAWGVALAGTPDAIEPFLVDAPPVESR